ncbi:MAG: phosphatase, partial [Negativicutes bacterium]|nr:phosphatase [Negativicutes bacterium]
MGKKLSGRKANRFAAIHLGSEKICLQVIEFTGVADIKIIEEAEREVFLAEETFRTGRISFDSVNEICDLLKGFKRLLAEYDVNDYSLVATTAVREAANQNFIIDQIRVRTGFDVKVIDMPQEVYLVYMALWRAMTEQNLIRQDDSVLFVDISSGGLGITLYRDDCICYQQNIHLGILRIKESFDRVQRDAIGFGRALTEYIGSNIQPIKDSLGSHTINQLVLSGWETRLLFKVMGITGNRRQWALVAKSDFSDMYNRVRNLNISQLSRKYKLTADEAEMAIPTFVLYRQIIEMTGVKSIFVPRTSMIDGICLFHAARFTDDPWLGGIERHIIGMAHTIGSKYCYDQTHATFVEQMATLI